MNCLFLFLTGGTGSGERIPYELPRRGGGARCPIRVTRRQGVGLIRLPAAPILPTRPAPTTGSGSSRRPRRAARRVRSRPVGPAWSQRRPHAPSTPPRPATPTAQRRSAPAAAASPSSGAGRSGGSRHRQGTCPARSRRPPRDGASSTRRRGNAPASPSSSIRSCAHSSRPSGKEKCVQHRANTASVHRATDRTGNDRIARDRDDAPVLGATMHAGSTGWTCPTASWATTAGRRRARWLCAAAGTTRISTSRSTSATGAARDVRPHDLRRRGRDRGDARAARRGVARRPFADRAGRPPRARFRRLRRWLVCAPDVRRHDRPRRRARRPAPGRRAAHPRAPRPARPAGRRPAGVEARPAGS